MRRHHALPILLAACAGVHCNDPVPQLPDGNVIIGVDDVPDSGDGADAETRPPPDGGTLPETDLGPRDAAPWADAGAMDAGFPAADAGEDTCETLTSTVVSVAEALARQAELLGQVIIVAGMATITDLACTDLACPSDNPCCNVCTGTVAFSGGLGIGGSPCFEGPGCQGNECSLVCQPPVLGTEGRYRGRLTVGPVLELFAVEP